MLIWLRIVRTRMRNNRAGTHETLIVWMGRMLRYSRLSLIEAWWLNWNRAANLIELLRLLNMHWMAANVVWRLLVHMRMLLRRRSCRRSRRMLEVRIGLVGVVVRLAERRARVRRHWGMWRQLVIIGVMLLRGYRLHVVAHVLDLGWRRRRRLLLLHLRVTRRRTWRYYLPNTLRRARGMHHVCAGHDLHLLLRLLLIWYRMGRRVAGLSGKIMVVIHARLQL